jgi:hypothetical protein
LGPVPSAAIETVIGAACGGAEDAEDAAIAAATILKSFLMPSPLGAALSRPQLSDMITQTIHRNNSACVVPDLSRSTILSLRDAA